VHAAEHQQHFGVAIRRHAAVIVSGGSLGKSGRIDASLDDDGGVLSAQPARREKSLPSA
jgi:hypothetical protein